MKRGAALTFLFLVLITPAAYPLEEVSARMTSLGVGLIGIVPDPYADLLRNPAYLLRGPRLLNVVTIRPGDGYRSGLFFNPTPFLTGAQGAAHVTFQAPYDYRPLATPASLFPLGSFVADGKSLVKDSRSSSLPPTDLIGSGRSFLGRNRYSPNQKALLATLSYAAPLTGALSIGSDFLWGEDGLGGPRLTYSEAADFFEYASYTRRSYARQESRLDSQEELRSLRVGACWELSQRYSLDLDVTASHSRGSSFSRYSFFSETVTAYEDTTYSERRAWSDDLLTGPSDKDVIEGNLFLHRRGEGGGLSVRLSLFSGDGTAVDRSSETTAENDSMIRLTSVEARGRAGWTGGLIGVGGYHELTGRPLRLFWGSFYGFLRGRQAEDLEEETGIAQNATLATHTENGWETHLWQVNAATEYDVIPAVAARLGVRATALLAQTDYTRESLTPIDPGAPGYRARERFKDLLTDAGITAGVAVRVSERLRLDIYTADLASPSAWLLESLLTF